MQKNYQKYSQLSRRIVWLSYLGLLVVLCLNTAVWPSCGREPNLVILGVQLALLLAFLPGIVRQNLRSHIWLTFMLLGFFTMSVSTAFACSSIFTIAEVVLVAVLFISAMLYIRWRSMALRQSSEVENS